VELSPQTSFVNGMDKQIFAGPGFVKNQNSSIDINHLL
jgi:hypothetical protein